MSSPTTISLGTFKGHAIGLEIHDPVTIRFRVAAGEDLAPHTSHGIIRNEWPASGASAPTVDGPVTRLRTAGLAIEWDSKRESLRVADAKTGAVLLSTPDHCLEIRETGIAISLGAVAKERIYGLAESGEKFEKTGRIFTQWNHNDPKHHPIQNYYCQIPLTYHLTPDGSRCRGQFMDNPGRVHVDLRHDLTGRVSLHCETGDIDLWLWFGDSMPAVVRAWSDMTGRMERPPMWSLGYQQCRWSYPTEKRVREIAEGFRSRRIPCDVIYLDIDYMDGYRVFTWSPEAFPQPEKLLGDLSAQGFRTVAIVDPGVKVDEGFEVYDTFLEKGYFVTLDGVPFQGRVWPGTTCYPDFLRADARKDWGEFQKTALLDKGIAGIWNDMNEPADFDGPNGTFPDDVRHLDNGRERRHVEVHQLYGFSMARASYEGQLAARPDTRPFTITRSGWAGVQRYSMVWTGDNQAIWNSMPFDLATNLSMGLCGISFVGCDIGGFGLNPTSELFERWFEWGVFQPFCRGHADHASIDQEPWAFTQEVEDNIRTLLELRMSLLPYLYTCFVDAAETGTPINRPLVYDYASDPQTHFVGDQFLIGSDLLIAPVMEPGMDRRMAYIPAGDWWDWWTGEKVQGGRHAIVSGPFGQPPLFVRAGAVVPMQRPLQYTDEAVIEETILDVWPGKELKGVLVEDDGASRQWMKGAESRIDFSGSASSTDLILRIGAPQGPYRGARKTWRIRLHGVGDRVRKVQSGSDVVAFESRKGVAEWTIQDSRNPLEISVKLAD
jgi:alpha-glucosidase